MTTSGTVTFRSTRDQLISSALRANGVLDPEVGTASPAQLTTGAEALNMLVKYWQAKGLQLWERKYGVIFPQKGQMVYVLGSPGPGGDHACLSTPMGTGFIQTTLSTAKSAGATSITVASTSTTGTVGVPSISMQNGDNIGIQQTDGTMFWTTINGAPSGTTITLATGLSVGSSSGAVVQSYTTKLVRPLRILDGFTRQSAGNDVPHLIIPRDQYNRFGVKTSAGTSIQTYYDPQENSGHLYVYPTTQDVTQLMYIEFQKPIDDFSSGTDDYDLPQEWGEAIKWNLAWRLGIEYGSPKEVMANIKELAMMTMTVLDGWDQEPTSLFIQPNNWTYHHGI